MVKIIPVWDNVGNKDLIISEITKYTEVDGKDINLVYYELDSENYLEGRKHKYIENLRKG